MSSIIRVENVSKAYRVGVETKKADTFAGALMNIVKSPLRNFRQISNLKNFERDQESLFWALKDVSFEVNTGDVVGVIGHNGAGKSTLLKILSRITEPSKGSIEIEGRINSLLEVGTGFHPDLTGRENVYMNGTILGMTKKEIDSKFDEIVEFSGISRHVDTPVKRYSSGMTVRLAFSVAAHLEPEILIIDEVLAVGDSEFQKKCLGKMKDVSQHGRTILFVSHNMAAVKNLCTRGILLKSGVVNFIGNADDTLKAYVKNQIDDRVKGVINDRNRRLKCSGEASFEKVRLYDAGAELTEEVYYGDALHFEIDLNIHQPLTDILMDVKITSMEGVVICHCMNTFGNKNLFKLNQGAQRVKVIIPNSLAPGNYSVALGLHFASGISIDHVEDVYDFTVMKVAVGSNFSYPYDWVHGYVHEEGNWQIIEN